MKEVINCTLQTGKKTERIKIITKATGKYLDIANLLRGCMHANLNEGKNVV